MIDNFIYTFKRISQKPLRSLLTIFQLSLGIWLVTVIFSMYFHADSELQHSSYMLDSEYAKIQLVAMDRQPTRTYYRAISTLETDDLVSLQEQSENIEQAFFSKQGFSLTVSYSDQKYTIQSVAETSASFAETVNLEIIEGYYFSELDENQGNNVILISKDISDYLFPNEQAVGKQLLSNVFTGVGMDRTEQYLEIIGVYNNLDSIEGNFLGGSHMLVPYGSGVLSPSNDGEHTVFIKALPGKLSDAIQDAQMILKSHLVEEARLLIETLQDQWEMQMSQLNILTIFLSIFGFIALVVSAVGVLCILLVSVYERTKEIGLRRALGASRGSVMKLFLGESLLYTGIAGIIGIIVAIFSAERLGIPLVTELLFGSSDGVWHFSWLAGVYALVLASLATLLVSFFPAYLASKIPPTEALREL